MAFISPPRIDDAFGEKTFLVMPVPDQVRDDVSGIPNMLALLDSGVRHNDKPWRPERMG